jgi:peptidoglycan/xylan/chitin deacetylase (PgdA/CDA1 family)
VNNYDIPIIMYHSINDYPQDNPLGCISLSTQGFHQHLLYLKKSGYELFSLTELLNRSYENDIGQSKIAVLTFDDGFLDFYLVAADILKQYGAHATLFVNPGQSTGNPARTMNHYPNAWGNLNFEEMREIEKQGTFDIQSHSLTHNFIFISDTLIDFYTPDKFNRYYWLAWMLFPNRVTDWYGDLPRLADCIPIGYPIFEWGRNLESKQFFPAPDFVELCIHRFSVEGKRCINDLQNAFAKGEYESNHSFSERIGYQLEESKKMIERKLGKRVDIICFPGDIYDEMSLKYAHDIGYKVFMRHVDDKLGKNIDVLKSIPMAFSQNKIVGLKRFCIINKFPRILPGKFSAKLTLELKIGEFSGNPIHSSILSSARSIKRNSKLLY